MSDEDVLFRAAERKHVIDNSAEEYLFWMMKRMEAGHGERYVFPFLRLEGCRNIGIYGAGAVGQAYYRQIQDNKKINLVGWYDRNAALENDDRISRPEDMNTDSLDKIIIAIEAKETADKVKDFLKGKGLSEEKIIWCI